MCKMVGVNRVMLGQRVIGLEMYSLDKQEVLGYTEKGLKDAIQNGDVVYGLYVTPDGQIDLTNEFNMMNKIGINTFTPIKDMGGMVADMDTLIEVKEDKGNKLYTFINQRFGKKELTEKKLLALMEIAEGNINGVRLQGDSLLTWFDSETAEPPKGEGKKDK